MILLGFIFLPYFLDCPSFFNIKFNSLFNLPSVSRFSKTSNYSLCYVISDLSHFPSAEKLAKQKFIEKNIWRDLVNTYWKQTVFLSVSDKFSNQYISQLNSLNIFRDKNKQKRLVSEFSKSLNNSLISATLLQRSMQSPEQTVPQVQYIWFKKLYFNPLAIFNRLTISRETEYFREVQKLLESQVNFDYLPVYVIANDLGQMIISEPSRQLVASANFLNTYKSTNLSESWFFINFQDAKEYLEYIQKSYGINSSTSLKIYTCNLSTFYKISSKYSQNMILRLVPDLSEVKNILTKYRYLNNISFYYKQKYGRDYFQGQPLYMINYQKIYKESILDNYLISFKNKKDKQSTLFTNYNTVDMFWKRVQKKSSNLKRLKKPPLIIYNLESFLKDQSKKLKDHKSSQQMILIPSEESYRYAKNTYINDSYVGLSHDFLDNLSYCKLWLQRIIWSLTSKQPKYD